MENTWSIGGYAKYRMTAQGDLQVAWQDLTPGTVADGTLIWAASSLPAAYRPATNHRVVCWTDGLKVNGATFEAAGFQLNTDGSVACYGFGTAATRGDLFETVPISI
jgi:hypothetical protein